MATAATRAIVVRSVFNGTVLFQVVRRQKCVPGGIRTPNLLIRSQKLYPVELQAQFLKIPSSKFQIPKSITKAWEFGFWDLELAKPGGRRDSNPQQPEPQSGALPLSYGHHHWRETRILKSESFFANKGLDFSRHSTNSRRRWNENLATAGLPWRPVIA